MYYFRPTFKNNFLVFESWIRTWNGFWLQLSTLQKAINWMPMPLCAESVLLWGSKTSGFLLAHLFLFFFSLFLFSWICKALTSCTELSRVTKVPRMVLFLEVGIPWNQMVLRTYIFIPQWKLKTNNFSVCVCVCVCVCMCACQVASVVSNSLQTYGL